MHEALLTGMVWSGYHLDAFWIGHSSYLDIDDDWPDATTKPPKGTHHTTVSLDALGSTPAYWLGDAAGGD